MTPLREDDLVHAIRKVLSDEPAGVVVPVGDDAAVVQAGDHDLVLTTDMLVEGVHFDPHGTSPQDLGYKAIGVNVSDVAAMGGSPRYALVALALPGEHEPAWVMELYGGMREAAGEYGLAIVGGDTSRAEQRVISVTVAGAVAKGRAVRRAGARPGDAIVVTGSLGLAAAGVRLESSPPHGVRGALVSEAGREAVRAHLRPVARVGEGQTLAAAGATAMMDVSDGLAIDLHRLCGESEVGAELRLGDVPVAEGLQELAEAVGTDALTLALEGGEDYELLATLPGAAVDEVRRKLVDRFATELTPIGHVTEPGSGIVLVDPDGSRSTLEPRGWDHFA